MSEVSKPEQHEHELVIHASRHEAGLYAMHQWLHGRQKVLSARWPSALGEDLTRMQGEALTINRLIKLIELGPTVKVQHATGSAT